MKKTNEIKNKIQAIRGAANWMQDAVKQLETPGGGLPDACDSANIAINMLESVNIIGTETKRCIFLLTKVVDDILPQMGKICLQDYAALNDGLILSRKILGKQQVKK